MKRIDILPFALLLPLLGFVAVQAVTRPALTTSTEAAALVPSNVRSAAGRVERAPRVTPEPAPATAAAIPAGPADSRDLGDIRRRVTLGSAGTYIDEILLERDSALTRWPDRVAEPVRVWIGSGSHLAGWNADFPARVRGAFEEWSGLGIPVRFVFVADSARADVRVGWIDHFDTPISGKTLWARDRNWWIVNANITIALHHNGGEPLDGSAVRAISLHEVGHLLGLDHTSDTLNIMTARVRARDLTEADRATMKLLYTLPAGSIK
jgi:hypothetical protein